MLTKAPSPSATKSAAEMSSQAEREMAAMRSECERANAAMRAHLPLWVARVAQTAPHANAATAAARLATENALFSDLMAAVGPLSAFAFEPYRGSLFEQASVAELQQIAASFERRSAFLERRAARRAARQEA